MPKLPKQTMRVKVKVHYGPESPQISTDWSRWHAYHTGKDAYSLYNKSITHSNPYKPGLLHDMWRQGYLDAARLPPALHTKTYGEGRAIQPNSQMSVRKTSRKKFKVKDNDKKLPKNINNSYLGYIKPPNRKFRVFTRNPPEPKLNSLPKGKDNGNGNQQVNNQDRSPLLQRPKQD